MSQNCNDFNFDTDVINGSLQNELSLNLEDKVILYRNNYFGLTRQRYYEMLSNRFVYENIPTSFDVYQLERMLINGYNVCVGLDIDNKLAILGYTNTAYFDYDIFINKRLSKKNIIFTIPVNKRAKVYTEITELEPNGNFVVIRNKYYNKMSDFNILNHYITKLAEIEASRYSLVIQSKAMTIFFGEHGDETTNQMVAKFYNGSPYIKLDSIIDSKRLIVPVDQSNLANNLISLKVEKKNTELEMHNILGIASRPIEKEGGMSPTEVGSNDPYIQTCLNVYLNARKKAIDLINDVFKMNIQIGTSSQSLPQPEDDQFIGASFRENDNEVGESI